jgi:hypothetical protein
VPTGNFTDDFPGQGSVLECGEHQMLYRPPIPAATSVAVPPIVTVTGRQVAHGHRTTVQSAFLAAHLHLNLAQLVSPTIKQSAVLAGICSPYAAAAIAIADDPDLCRAVTDGKISLLDAARAEQSESLADHLLRSSLEELKEAGAKVGVNMVFDTMVSPNV